MTPDQVIVVLAWAAAGLLVTVVALACWIVVRNFAEQSDRNKEDAVRWAALNTRLTNEFSEFGKSLNEVRDLLTADIHKHDTRLVRLEEWRKSQDRNNERPA